MRPCVRKTNVVCYHPLSLDFSSLYRCGDEILEINEAAVQNMTLNEVYAVLSHCSPGAVQIIISRHPDPQVAFYIFLLLNTANIAEQRLVLVEKLQITLAIINKRR